MELGTLHLGSHNPTYILPVIHKQHVIDTEWGEDSAQLFHIMTNDSSELFVFSVGTFYF